ncbi:hypothetical protein JAAARDRAFT_319870 [Jaapia argillacea MUCL 33604]|uniref:Uncharacterized protein n=1 Tax=Jaapia argillacea MUCL 33604 TaxID=933084 RepID=A0A067Q0D8_9AGAM|nr:hypothetical protein JAAARDRAFT_319870 [Jaapia argillacea MUCL 33604]
MSIPSSRLCPPIAIAALRSCHLSRRYPPNSSEPFSWLPTGHNVAPSTMNGYSNFGAVYPSFRGVAVQTPGLWGDILLSVGHDDDNDHTERPPMEYLEMCLRRSGNIQLQIFSARLCDKCHIGDNRCPRLDRCMELIAPPLPHLSRIQAIAVIINTMEIPDNLFDHLHHVLVMETFYIHDEYDCLTLKFPIFQGGAPQL